MGQASESACHVPLAWPHPEDRSVTDPAVLFVFCPVLRSLQPVAEVSSCFSGRLQFPAVFRSLQPVAEVSSRFSGRSQLPRYRRLFGCCMCLGTCTTGMFRFCPHSDWNMPEEKK